jgi:hypothetical protein
MYENYSEVLIPLERLDTETTNVSPLGYSYIALSQSIETFDPESNLLKAAFLSVAATESINFYEALSLIQTREHPAFQHKDIKQILFIVNGVISLEDSTVMADIATHYAKSENSFVASPVARTINVQAIDIEQKPIGGKLPGFFMEFLGTFQERMDTVNSDSQK